MVHYLVDTSWCLYRGYFSCSKVWADYPELHFLCKKLESLLSRKDCIVYLCLDGRYTKGKKLLGDGYKAGRRAEGSYNVYKGLASFVHLLNNNRIHVCYNNEYESDELIYTLSRTLEGRKKIISGDKDLLQALTKDVIIDNGKDLVITEESYKFDYADTFFELNPDRLPIFRAIVGDASDTLKPPVSRFPKKLAAKIAAEIDYTGEVPSIDQIKNVSKNYSTSELKQVNKLIDAYNAFSINFDIMKLNVIQDNINKYYDYSEVELSDFLRSKIEHLNNI